MCEDGSTIWSFDCAALCSLLGLAFDSKALRKFCAKHDLAKDVKNPDDGFRLFCIHRACHEENGAVARQLTKLFNERFAMIIKSIRSNAGDDEVKTNELFEKWYAMNPAGLIWSLLTDSRACIQYSGNYFVHRALYSGLREMRKESAVAQGAEAACVQLSKSLAKAQKNSAEQKSQISELKTLLQQTRDEVVSVQLKNEVQEKELLRFRDGAADSDERSLRKLEYELRQARQTIELLEEKLSTNDAEFSEVAQENSEEVVAFCSMRKTLDCSCDSGECEACPLASKRVAIVGGLHRLEPKYKEAVESLGGECLFHGGICQGGSESLKNAVKRSDIVVFITRINSHTALNVVRTICKKTNKRFLAVRETGPQAIAEALRYAS